MLPTGSDRDYFLFDSDGGVFSFGSALLLESLS
jgi:hypothetical protein